MSVCVLYLVQDIQHAFIVFHLFLSQLLVCFIWSRMRIWYTFLFTCFLDRFQLVLHEFLNQFFIEVVIFYFQQYFFDLKVHLFQWYLKSCHIFRIFTRFKLLFGFISIYFLTFLLILVSKFIYLVQQVFSFVWLKTKWRMNDKMYVHDHNTLVRSFYYDKWYNLKIFS